MPLLLDAAVHRFAEDYLLDMTQQVLEDARCERRIVYDLANFYRIQNDLMKFHHVCAQLADDKEHNWSHDSVVDCNAEALEQAEMLFGRLSREQPGERRWGLLHRFHGLVVCVAEGEPIGENSARSMLRL